MSIRFYVSWYPGDPIYSAYMADCALLISPTSLSQQWCIRELPTLPTRLILDSGGFRYLNSSERPPTATALLNRQLGIINGVEIPTLLCPLDSPLRPGSMPVVTTDHQIASTLAHAFELQRLIRHCPLPSHVETLAIVQGNDAGSLTYCARELLAMGFQHFGIGSLARIPDPTEVAHRVGIVYGIVQRPVHLFGVASPLVLRHLESTWIASVDSSQPAKMAAYNEILYNHPFRRYGIKTADGVSRSKLSVQRCIAQPLECACPICQSDPAAIMRIGRRDHIRARAVHNYYHLRAAVEEL